PAFAQLLVAADDLEELLHRLAVAAIRRVRAREREARLVIVGRDREPRAKRILARALRARAGIGDALPDGLDARLPVGVVLHLLELALGLVVPAGGEMRLRAQERLFRRRRQEALEERAHLALR